jgi:hypothetical protein
LQAVFSFRMRIENWELNIDQILPSPRSAKLFLREFIPNSLSPSIAGVSAGAG